MATLVLDEDQQMLARTAQDFVRNNTPVEAFRKLRHGDVGIDRALWKEMAELGWAGLVLPEALGGLDLGYAELGLVAEQLGSQLVSTPLLSSVVLAGNALLLAGSESQQKQLAQVAEGDRLLALAYQEGPHHAPTRCATRAEPDGDGFVVHGQKGWVLDGQLADTLIVVARTSGADTEREGLTLLLVPRDAAGLAVEPTGSVDGRPVATLKLENVRVSASDVVGAVGAAAEVLDRVFDRAAVVLAAEMLGGMQAAFEMTTEYLKTRKQFGVLIGTFQALKHRAADMYCEIELTRSAVLDALRAIDEGRDDASLAVTIAKARASDVFMQVAGEAIQMHGGIGVTDEHDVGLYYKRARVAELLFGDGGYQRARFAELSGY